MTSMSVHEWCGPFCNTILTDVAFLRLDTKAFGRVMEALQMIAYVANGRFTEIQMEGKHHAVAKLENVEGPEGARSTMLLRIPLNQLGGS